MAFYYVLFIIGFTVIFRNYIRRVFWKSTIDNIPGPSAKSLWTGVFYQVFNVNGWDFHKEIAEKYGRVIKIPSFLGENWLYIFDPKALHHVVVKEQYIFEETSAFIEGNKLVFGHGLLGTLGEQHRKQRKMLNPVFSIAHMREMIPIFYNVGHKLRAAFERKVQEGPQEIEILHWMSRTALELIAQSGLGASFDDLMEDRPPHEYASTYKRLQPTAFKFIFFRNYFLPTLVKIGSPKFRRFLVDMLPGENLRHMKNIVDVLYRNSVRIYEEKKTAILKGDGSISSHIGQGKDVMSILIRANLSASEKESLTEEEVLGQVTSLTFAATDTTSGALARILHLLALNHDVQQKVREEILEAKEEINGDFDYDKLVSMPYLDAVCRETLRLYPPVSMVTRTTRRDAIIPLSRPIKGLDGKEVHEIPVPNNTNVIVGIMASNRNPELWGPDALEWKPERWLEPLPESVTEAHIPGIYSNLMTFLGGGRACIGFKFSQLEMKVILSLLIEHFRFSLSEKEIAWQMYGVSAPSVLGSDGKLLHGQLSLVVERVR